MLPARLVAASAFARWAFLLYAVFDAGRAESLATGRADEVLGESFENVGFSPGRVRPPACGRPPEAGREEERSPPLLYGRVLVLLSLRSSENLRTGRSPDLLSLRSSENLRTGRSLENFRSLRSPEEESCPKSLRPVGLAKPVGRLPAGGLPVERPADGRPDDGRPEDDSPKVFPAEYGRFGALAEDPSEESLLCERFHAPSGRGDDEKRLPVLELEPEREPEYVPDDDVRDPERGAPDDDDVERAPAREFPVPELERELELGRELEPGRGLEPERGLDDERAPERETPDDDDVERAPARELPELEPERGLEAERVLPPEDEPLLGADLGRVGRGIMLAFDEKRVLLRGAFEVWKIVRRVRQKWFASMKAARSHRFIPYSTWYQLFQKALVFERLPEYPRVLPLALQVRAAWAGLQYSAVRKVGEIRPSCRTEAAYRQIRCARQW